MKKIMFNDKYGLCQSVLDGRKTQTRRIAYDFRKHTSNKVTKCVILPSGSITYMDGKIQVLDDMPQPAYKVGEEVAVAQSYRDVSWYKPIQDMVNGDVYNASCSKNWANKMFVCADLMPHRIRITNVRVERLQDISDEDCLKEGVFETPNKWYAYEKPDKSRAKRPIAYSTPRLAFAALIDKTCGRGTWDSNPYVFVYDFELVK